MKIPEKRPFALPLVGAWWLAAFVLLPANLPALAQDYTVPRIAEGWPDLSGVWNFNTSTPFERPAQLGEREFLTAEEINRREAQRLTREQNTQAREADLASRIIDQPTDDPGAYNAFWSDSEELYPNIRTSLVVYPADGRLPPLAPGAVLQRSPPSIAPCGNGEVPRPVRISWGALSCDRPEDFGLATRCLYFPHAGPPHTAGTSYNNNLQIIQTADYVVIKAEMGNDPRIIPLGDRPFPDPRIRSWTGYSRGHFEGDTLVVETRNVVPEMASLFLRSLAYGSAGNRVIVERFTRVGEIAMDYEVSIEDPDTFTDRIVLRNNMSKIDGQIYEYACHEGNYALLNMLRIARMEDAAR